MNKQSVTLFYKNSVRDDCEKIGNLIIDNNLVWGSYSESGFTVGIYDDLVGNLERLFGDDVEGYPNLVFASSDESEKIVRDIVRKNGGVFSGLRNVENLDIKRIDYGVQKSDLYRFLEVVGYGCRAIGF